MLCASMQGFGVILIGAGVDSMVSSYINGSNLLGLI